MNDNFSYTKSREFLRKQEKAEQSRNFHFFKKASEDCARIVEMIKSYNPNRIYQWGSLLNSEDFDINSDIDIAIEGLDSTEKFFELFGKALEITDFPLDLVEIEKIEKVHAESIKKQGKVIYEK